MLTGRSDVLLTALSTGDTKRPKIASLRKSLWSCTMLIKILVSILPNEIILVEFGEAEISSEHCHNDMLLYFKSQKWL